MTEVTSLCPQKVNNSFNKKGKYMEKTFPVKNCPMRHPTNGNCLPAGGFCTANKSLCEAFQSAYKMGMQDGLNRVAYTLKEAGATDIITNIANAMKKENYCYSRNRYCKYAKAKNSIPSTEQCDMNLCPETNSPCIY